MKRSERTFAFPRIGAVSGFAADFDMITVKGVEDLKILFEAFGDFGPDDGCV